MKKLLTSWTVLNNLVLKKYPLLWMANTHIVILFSLIIAVFYLFLFGLAQPSSPMYIQGLPFYINVLIMFVVLYLCGVKRKLLRTWQNFIRYFSYLILNIVILSVLLAVTSLRNNPDPLHVNNTWKRSGQLQEHYNRLSDTLKTYGTEAGLDFQYQDGAKILLAAGIVPSVHPDSLSLRLSPDHIQKLKNIEEVLGPYLYDHSYSSDTLPPDHEGFLQNVTYIELFNYRMDLAAMDYFKRAEFLSPINFLLGSFFLLSNMLFFFLTIQVNEKKESFKNLWYYVVQVVGILVTLVLVQIIPENYRNITTVAALVLSIILINFLFHGIYQFVEGIQKLLVLLHGLLWLMVLILAGSPDTRTILILAEIVLLVISASITFYIFKRFYQPKYSL
jgi:hypothetical protein